jgi:hypothetical protein
MGSEMNIDVISNGLAFFQGNLKPNYEDTKPAAKQVSETNEIDTRQDNLMAGNFLDPNREKSKYVKATLQSFETQRTVNNKMDSIVSMLAAQIEDPGSTAEAFATSLRAKRMLRQVQNAEVVKESEDYLKSDREKLEESAQGTPASGDAQGASAQAADNSDSGSASTSEAEAAPAPEAAAASVDITV